MYEAHLVCRKSVGYWSRNLVSWLRDEFSKKCALFKWIAQLANWESQHWLLLIWPRTSAQGRSVAQHRRSAVSGCQRARCAILSVLSLSAKICAPKMFSFKIVVWRCPQSNSGKRAQTADFSPFCVLAENHRFCQISCFKPKILIFLRSSWLGRSTKNSEKMSVFVVFVAFHEFVGS